MPIFTVWIKNPGRGPIKRRMSAPNKAVIHAQARRWLESKTRCKIYIGAEPPKGWAD